MKPKEKRERKLKAWILKYIRNLQKFMVFMVMVMTKIGMTAKCLGFFGMYVMK